MPAPATFWPRTPPREQEEAKLEAKLKVTDGGALFQAEPEAQKSLQAAWARALVGADNYTDT